MKTIAPLPTSSARRLFGLLLAASLTSSACAAIDLNIDVGDLSLAPDTSSATADLYIDNLGDTALQAQGLTFRIELDDGLGGGNAPILTAVDLVTGTPWAGQLGSVTDQTTDPEFWDVRVLSDIFGGKYAQLDAGSHTKLATLTFDTTGFTAGTWALKLGNFDLSPNPGDTKFNYYGTGNELFPTINNGTYSVLSAVPEPSTGLAGVFLLGVTALHWFRRRRSSGN